MAKPTGLACLLGGWAAGLDERRRIVFDHRIARTDRLLAELGRSQGVSKERTRQLQVRLTRELSAWLQQGTVADEVASLRARLHAACPVVRPWSQIQRAVPELAQLVPGTDVHVRDLTAIVIPELHQDGAWAAWQPIAALRSKTVDTATRSLPVAKRRTRMAALQRNLVLDPAQWDTWLSTCGLHMYRGWVVRSNATVSELAEALLAAEGRPMNSAEIALHIGVRRWQVRDECLGRDQRFRRTGPGVFALAEWELPAYRGIRREITEEVLAAGGQARLNDVAANLARRFGVSPSSVAHYARGPEFAQSDGMVRLAGAGQDTRSFDLHLAQDYSPNDK